MPVPAATVPRRFSRLLVSDCPYPERPKVIVLTLGGRSDACDALLKYWEAEACGEEFNFCAIEAGDAAEADGYLSNLLCSHVPLDTCIHIVQRDAEVPGEELKRVQALLNQLQISVATIQPLLANEYEHWFSPLIELEDATEARLEHSGPMPGDQERMFDQRRLQSEALAIQQKIDELDRRILECRNETSHLNEILRQNAATATVRQPSMPPSIAKAFNLLQFTSHWQAAARTRGAKVMCALLDRISIDKAVQCQVQYALEAVLTAMTHDRAVLESVLSVAVQLPADSESVDAVSRMHVACMEQRVASGNS